jgi:hypothetical protein
MGSRRRVKATNRWRALRVKGELRPACFGQAGSVPNIGPENLTDESSHEIFQQINKSTDGLSQFQ